MLPLSNWSYPTAVRFGAGRISELAESCRSVGLAAPLIVTDPFLATQPMTEAVFDQLKTAGLKVGLFSEVKPNPVETNVYKGVEALRAGGHDGVVAFGGGSALDTGKVIAFMVGQTLPLWECAVMVDGLSRADANGIRPIIAVPTTAGTGSEVGRSGVITQEATRTKKIISHPLMMPKITICDPELTRSMPPHITAGTGLDALAHCIEAYCAVGYHPMAEGIAVEGVRLVKEYLPRAFKDGADLEARAHMMSAAAMGATAFQKGLGAIHALSHPLGALYDTHHGLTNAVVMPYVLAYNREIITPKIERLAAYLGVDASFDAFLDWILELRRQLGVPHTLDGLKVNDEHFEEMSTAAQHDPTAKANPIPVTKESALALYENALAGRL